MYGALIGDCVGSFWEFSGNKDPDFPLWVPACRFTDDSVCTAAMANWLVDQGQGAGKVLHRVARGHVGAGFGNLMTAWLLSDQPKPQKSWGNGSAMRVSPVALWAADEEELLRLARESALPTHHTPEAINGAKATAWAIRQAFEHRDPAALLLQVEQRFGYEGLSALDPILVRPTHRFDVSCAGTVPLALAIACTAGSFDQTLRLCCSMGGDADTLGAIAGPVAEALYGIPAQHMENARARFPVEDELWEAVEAIYQTPAVKERLTKWGWPNGSTVIEQTDPRRVPPIHACA